MVDRPEREGPSGEQPDDELASALSAATDATAAESGDTSEENGARGHVISPEVLARLREVLARSLRPQIDGLAQSLRTPLPRVEVAQLALPDIDALITEVVNTALPNMQSLIARMVLELPSLRGLRAQMQLLVDKHPPNWRSDVDPFLAWPVLQEEGIPLVWVPRAEIVSELLAAPDRDARVKVLLAHDAAVANDCRAVLAKVRHPDLTEQVPLGFKAIDAFAAGHHEASQALAVVVVETVVGRMVEPKKQVKGERKSKYQRIVAALKVADPKEITAGEMRLRAAMAPIAPFFVPWTPDSGEPAPLELSRHVSVHQAHVEHYTQGNAIVAIMMVSSVLRGIQEMVESSDDL